MEVVSSRLGAVLGAALAAVAMALTVSCEADDGGTQGDANTVPHRGEVILATTTSTLDSGLLDVLLPLFERRTGWAVKPIAAGSGQAMTMGRRGDADVLLVHSPAAEATFMSEGYGSGRLLVMHNEFVIVGPGSDPAGVRSARTASDAMKAIQSRGATFISRGDNSGTHALELALWRAASIDPRGNRWYQETGQGMGATLQVADQKAAYTITDRATYLALKKNLALQVVSEGDKAYFNVYHVITLNPQKNPKINVEGANAFAEFMLSREAQEVIRTFGVDKYGEPLFVPDAGKSEDALGAR
ncbi:MAG TPA: substrate-binding domain-containing protein [Dehalococcoidia bacterium]|nr:substrate-binding domain-containing protein [Dehalococcoidia bacterium]